MKPGFHVNHFKIAGSSNSREKKLKDKPSYYQSADTITSVTNFPDISSLRNSPQYQKALSHEAGALHPKDFVKENNEDEPPLTLLSGPFWGRAVCNAGVRLAQKMVKTGVTVNLNGLKILRISLKKKRKRS